VVAPAQHLRLSLDVAPVSHVEKVARPAFFLTAEGDRQSAAGLPHEGHWPNLQTLLMIEKAKEAVTQPKRTALWLSLP
jgi:hypothetical protein